MKITNKKTRLETPFVFIAFILFYFFQMNFIKAQTAIQVNESNTEELNWNVATTELTDEEKRLNEETDLGWEKWDAEHPNETVTVIYEEKINTESKSNKVKSPNEILRSALVGKWEGFYGGRKAYINFKENKTVVINTSAFSNIPSASGREHTQLYYEIDASQSPYRLIFYNRDKEIKGVFRIQDNNQITICHNFKNDEQPQEISNKYTTISFYKLDTQETETN